MENGSIGQRVIQLREYFGLKQGELSKELNMSQANISRIEADLMEPSEAFLNALILRYSINSEWIMTGKGEMLIPPEEYIIKGINKYGVKTFGEGLAQVFKDQQFVELFSFVSVDEKNTDTINEELISFLRYFLDLWQYGDKQKKNWILCQLKRTLPKGNDKVK